MLRHVNGRGCSMGDIVISGISVKMPLSTNLEEFRDNLMNGVDMITEDERRWPLGLYDMPTRFGKIDSIDRFDSDFFGVHPKQVNVMDPQLRILLELTYEAIVDSGSNPHDMEGSKTGVFVGSPQNEAEEYWTSDPEKNNGYALTGSNRSMFANRISFSFDFRGPSYVVDTACSSSALALYQAFYHMQMGICDSAIVCGVNLILKPENLLSLVRLNMVSADGKCKTFDASADGYVRSEGAVVLFLQKKSAALRMYASVISVMTNTDGAKEQGIMFPSAERQKELTKTLYNDIGIDPNTISYVEAHGTGTKVGDSVEIKSIVDVFCSCRKEPLLIGSVKTNVGHTETCSGVCAIAKVIASMESGMLPPNLHFNVPNPNIPGLHNGKLKVIKEKTPWNGGLVAINSFGIGGANVHILLQSNPKEKKPKTVKLPRLVTVSGRTEEAVQYFLDYVINKEEDPEFLALIDNVHRRDIKRHNYRGYAVLNSEAQKEIKLSSQGCPVWFLFSGMGSQWPQMARDMMVLPVFRKSIEKSATPLRELDIDLIDVLVNSTPQYFDNVLNSFVAIAAVQIALVDMLYSMNIKADGLIGHSAGELGCAYADGGLTAEQTILLAYWRGRCSLDAQLEPGLMAAVSMSKEEFEAKNLPDIFISCHNSDNSITISGPHDGVKEFVKESKAKNIFATIVNTGGIAYHSKYVEPIAPALLKKLKNVIINPKSRSSHWITTSALEVKLNDLNANLCSAEYFVNNLVSLVNFHNTVKHIPEHAILIEIAPHGLLQTIVKRSLPETVSHISLMMRYNQDNIKHFLNNIGKLYIAGAQPQVSKLYGPVSFPVSRSTHMLAPCIKWDHSTAWDYPNFNEKVFSAGNNIYEFDLSKPENKFLTENIISGTALFPVTGYLMLVWRSIAKLNNTNLEMIPVIFEDVEVLSTTTLPKQGKVKFSVNLLHGTDYFNVTIENTVAVSGTVRICKEPEEETIKLNVTDKNSYSNANHLYKELRLRGYECSGIQDIVSCNEGCSTAIIAWHNNWITFLDAMIYLSIFSQSSRKLCVPRRLQKLIINPKKQLKILNSLSSEKHIPAQFDVALNVIHCGGVEIRRIEMSPILNETEMQCPLIEKYIFVPFEGTTLPSKDEALRATLHIALENVGTWDLRIVVVTSSSSAKNLLATKTRDILQSAPKVNVQISMAAVQSSSLNVHKFTDPAIMVTSKDIHSGSMENKCHLILASNLIQNNKLGSLPSMSQCLNIHGVIVLEESTISIDNKVLSEDLKIFDLVVLSFITTEDCSYILLRKKFVLPHDCSIVSLTEKNLTWVENLKLVLRNNTNTNGRIFIISQNERTSGAVGLINCLRWEPGAQNVRLFFIQDDNLEHFNVKSNFYKQQIQKDLLVNVYHKGQWGSYRHFPISEGIDSNLLPMEHAYVDTLTRGDLSSLQWIESPINTTKLNFSKHQLCSVYYSAINSKDMLLVNGNISSKSFHFKTDDDDCIGMEYSGITGDKKRVMGIVQKRGIATSVIIDPVFTWLVPDEWTLEQAATVPVVYATVYYGLLIRGKLCSGESILVHDAACSVGIAAITIALQMGCTIFVTVDSAEKKEFIKKYFPQISNNHIGSSCDISFDQLIKVITNGRGVDVILNLHSPEKLRALLHCLTTRGRFLAIEKVNREMLKNIDLGMKTFLMNISFHEIHVDVFMNEEPQIKDEIARKLSAGIASGVVRPLPAIIFDDSQLQQAFELMMTKKHVEKVVIQLRMEENDKPIPQKLVNAVPKLLMNPNKSYIIVGGLGGFGLELFQWLISLGASNFVLSSRRGIRTTYQSYCINRWRKYGVNVIVSTADVTTLSGAYELTKEACALAPIGGIFNLALIMKNALMENQTLSNFEEVTNPKVLGTKNLDITSRNLAPYLDHFVVFSSFSSGRGFAGLSNYGLANSAMERICEVRKEAGLPGLAIQWGTIADVGYMIESKDTKMKINEIELQKISSCLNVLSTLMLSSYPVVCSMVLAEKTSKSDSERDMILIITNILGLKDSSKIPDTTKLSDLGLDSLLTSEIRQILKINFDLSLSAAEVKLLTIDKLKKMAAASGNRHE